MSNSHSLLLMVMPAECHFGPHVGGLAEEAGHLSFLEFGGGKPPLRKIKEGKGKDEK